MKSALRRDDPRLDVVKTPIPMALVLAAKSYTEQIAPGASVPPLSASIRSAMADAICDAIGIECSAKSDSYLAAMIVALHDRAAKE